MTSIQMKKTFTKTALPISLFVLLVFLVIGRAALVQGGGSPTNTIEIESGKIVGLVSGENQDVRAFKGIISYAKSPLGPSVTSVRLVEERALLEKEGEALALLKTQEETRKIEEESQRSEEERKKLDLERVQTQQPPELDYGQEVGRDGAYIAYANGIVKDTKTGLEWMAGPDIEMGWTVANRWVRSLSVGGGGWRMPTMKELESLFERGKGTRNMTPLLKVAGWWIWSGDNAPRGGNVYFAFGFSSGGTRDDHDLHRANGALAVRSRSSG